MQFRKYSVVKSRLSALFEPIPEIRKSIFSVEEKLRDKFLTPELTPIPDEAPHELPRITLTSRHGFTTIKIAQKRADMDTGYDANFGADIEKCFGYIKEKSENLKIALDVANVKLSFLALSVTVRWLEDPKKEYDFAKELSDILLPEVLRQERIYDLRVSATSRVDEHYYLIATFSNYRTFQIKSPNTVYPKFDNLNILECGIEKEIEVNNRLGYNLGKPIKEFSALDDFFPLIYNEIKEPVKIKS